MFHKDFIIRVEFLMEAAIFSETSYIYPNDGGSILFLNVYSLHNSSKLT